MKLIRAPQFHEFAVAHDRVRGNRRVEFPPWQSFEFKELKVLDDGWSRRIRRVLRVLQSTYSSVEEALRPRDILHEVLLQQRVVE